MAQDYPADELHVTVHPTMTDACLVTWQGRADHTYFVQHSTDLMAWSYLDIIETGEDAEISYGFQSTADTDFWRLHVIDEVAADPAGADFDHDGLSNADELTQYGTSPLIADSDSDGLGDGWEVLHGYDPVLDEGAANADPDGDGLTNLEEYQAGTDPHNADTDGDGLSDAWEVAHGFNPLVAADVPGDSDGNRLSDSWEMTHFGNIGVDPNADPDGDRRTNLQEFNLGSDPNVSDVPHPKYALIPLRFSEEVLTWNARGEVLLLADGFNPSSVSVQPFFRRWKPDTGYTDLVYTAGPDVSSLYGSEVAPARAVFNGEGAVALALAGSDLAKWTVYWPADSAVAQDIRSQNYTDSRLPGEDYQTVIVAAIDGQGHLYGQYLLGGSFADNGDGGVSFDGDEQQVRWDYPPAASGVTYPGVYQIVDVNDSGVMVGIDDSYQWFIGTVDTHVDFYPYNINSSGVVLGLDYPDYVLWRNGITVTVGLPEDVSSWQRVDDSLNLIGRDFVGNRVTRPIGANELNLLFPEKAFAFPILPAGWTSEWLVDPDNESIQFSTGIFTDPTDPNAEPEALRFLAIRAELAVDADRDGTITLSGEGDSDATTADKPYRFWLNDDDDGDALNDEQEVYGGTAKDYESCGDFGIASKRDLEDFARLWLSVKGITAALKSGDLQLGFKWMDGYTGTPMINLYLHYEADGGTKYLTDTPTAVGQTSNPWSATLVSTTAKNVIAPGDIFVLKKEVFASLTEEQPTAHFLFEGAGEGKGQLQMVILDKNGAPIGEGPSVWLDLMNVKSMYERATSTPDETHRPYLFGSSAPSESYFSFSVDTTNAYVKPPDEALTVLVFVHGWNMTYAEYLGFSETMFKRLWWQGYKGRFCSLRWATMTSVDSYNTSEFWAWRYGQSLTTYVSDIKSRLSGYSVSVAAHSMGNIVTGSALNRGMTLNRYFLMEAAVPSGCYNDSVNNYSVFAAEEVSKPTPDTTEDFGYRLYLQSAVGASSVGKVVNFYNEIDFALATGSTFPIGATNWEQNQRNYKPDDPLGIGQYHYDPVQPAGQRGTLTFITGSRFITDVNESMAYLARPRSKAMGAEPDSVNVFPASINLRNEYDFGDTRSDHSGQFHRRIQQLTGFYHQIFSELQ